MSPLKAGDKAPQFSLPDQDGEIINLSDYVGQRVLVYFCEGDDARLYCSGMWSA